jgi:Neutral/alkaline non-lysosomal ceramidase, N-terminal
MRRFIMVGAVAVLFARPVLADDLTVGAAAVDITPPVGFRMAGYFNERLSTGTHDPLMAKALVIGDGKTSAAVVCCDLIGIGPEVAAKARLLIAEQTKIPGEHVMLTATHAHTGPMYWGALRSYLRARAIEKNGSDPHEPIDYSDFVARKVAEAVAAAALDAKAAKLSAGVAERTGLSFNRRFHMKDGKVQTNPGKLNPNIVRVAGPIDPDVGILLFRAAKGDKPLASLTVFALHLDTVGGTEYAADYPYYLAERLKREHGDRFVSLFGNGTCGDINHVDVTHDRPQKGHGEAERIGNALADTVIELMPKLRVVDKVHLAVASQTVAAETPQYSVERVEQAKDDMAKIGTRETPFLEQVETCRILNIAERGGKLPLEVQVIRIADDVAIVGLPGEVFVELGLAIKRASPFATTLVIELANDDPAYIPTKKAFAEGSYETVNSCVTPGAGEALVEAATKLLDELERAK